MRPHNAHDVESALRAAVVPGKKELLGRFFKTGLGQYGHGDVFIGVMVPQQRVIAKKFVDLPIADVEKLLLSKIHEFRLTALIILTYQYEQAGKKNDAARRKEIYDFYLTHTAYINNWDLVDVTAPRIVGAYLLARKNERKLLHALSRSENLWERRIAILSTMMFIAHNDFDNTLQIAERFLDDDHDLMHKSTGWMLREVGKRDEKKLCAFLDTHAKRMPRTMLRYAIEKFDEKKRKMYLSMK